MHTHMNLFFLVFTHVIFIPSNWHFHTNTFWWHSKIFPFLKQQTWMISTLHNFIGPIFPHSWKYFLEISKNSSQKLQDHSQYLFLDFQNRQPLPILKIWRGMGYICNSSCVYSRFPRQYISVPWKSGGRCMGMWWLMVHMTHACRWQILVCHRHSWAYRHVWNVWANPSYFISLTSYYVTVLIYVIQYNSYSSYMAQSSTSPF